MRVLSILVFVLAVCGCDGQTLDPCLDTPSNRVLEIVAVRDLATGASASNLSLSNIRLEGTPLDTTILRTNVLRNVERTNDGIACTLPCRFGVEPGMYAFDVRAPGFYPGHSEVIAEYRNAPTGCPASDGDPTQHAVDLVEADSARAVFSYVFRNGTGLQQGDVSVTFDDGSGSRTMVPAHPWQTFVTRNAGTLSVRFVVGAPDTLAAGEIELPLMKDWRWGVAAYVSDRNPEDDSFCVEAKSFPLRGAIANADSLYIAWGGSQLSVESAC
jgi:hypothetical protein